MEGQERGGGALGTVVDEADDDDAMIPEAVRRFQKDRDDRGDRKESSEAKVWESVHSLLTWLGIISLVPFDLNTIHLSLDQQQEHHYPHIVHWGRF